VTSIANLFPAVRLEYRFDDNVGLASDNEIDGNALVVSPELRFVASSGQLEFSTNYQGEYTFSDREVLEDDEHRLSATLDAELDSRQTVDLSVSIARITDDLGEQLTEGLTDGLTEQVAFNRSAVSARYTYGAANAQGNIGVGFRLLDLSYVNLPDVTEGLDYVRFEPFALFSYRLSGDTRAVIEARFSSSDHDDDDDDRTQLGLLGGLDFSPAGKLRGTVRIGVQSVQFDLDETDDAVILRVETDLEWQPRTFSTVSFGVTRESDELASASAESDQAVRTIVELNWRHRWSSRLTSSAYAALNARERACPTVSTTVTSAGFELNLAVKRWLEFGVSALTAHRATNKCPDDTSEGDLAYDRARAGIHMRVTL